MGRWGEVVGDSAVVDADGVGGGCVLDLVVKRAEEEQREKRKEFRRYCHGHGRRRVLGFGMELASD